MEVYQDAHDFANDYHYNHFKKIVLLHTMLGQTLLINIFILIMMAKLKPLEN